jgi:exonuclease VII small subunit
MKGQCEQRLEQVQQLLSNARQSLQSQMHEQQALQDTIRVQQIAVRM